MPPFDPQHTLAKTALHEHPVEPPGRRSPQRLLLYLAGTVLAFLAILGVLALIDAVGWFGK